MSKRIPIAGLAFAAMLSAMPASAGQQYSTCSVEAVAAFSNRVHIKCMLSAASALTPQGNANFKLGATPYLAVETNSPLAALALQLGLAWKTDGKLSVGVYYDDSAGANPPGCQQNDCRRLLGIEVR